MPELHSFELHVSVTSVIFEELDPIEKILRHLSLWDVRNHDLPQKVSDYILELVCDEADSRIPILYLTKSKFLSLILQPYDIDRHDAFQTEILNNQPDNRRHYTAMADTVTFGIWHVGSISCLKAKAMSRKVPAKKMNRGIPVILQRYRKE